MNKEDLDIDYYIKIPDNTKQFFLIKKLQCKNKEHVCIPKEEECLQITC